eukprot:scaffold6301_cov165-Amphora_coffeaeformis.AAC.7
MILLERRSIVTLITSLFGYETPRGSECLSFSQAAGLIQRQCPDEFLAAVQKSGKFLYRGESVSCPTILNPPYDLLDPVTYGNDTEVLNFFNCLEHKYRDKPIRPSNGHIGTAKRQDAAFWGPPCSILPLGRPFNFMWPHDSALYYPGCSCTSEFAVGKDLVDAFVLEKEIMFASPSFLVIPESYETDLKTIMF